MPKVNRSSFLVVGVLTVGLGTSASIAACSSDTTTTSDPGDAAPEASSKIDSGSSSSSGSSGQTEGGTATDCETKCFQDHPTGEMRYDAIDVCWEAKCKGPCVDSSGMFDAGADAGDAGDGAVLCGTEVTSGVDMACDQCTDAFCCAEWQGCFKNDDCIALNDCLSECP